MPRRGGDMTRCGCWWAPTRRDSSTTKDDQNHMVLTHYPSTTTQLRHGGGYPPCLRKTFKGHMPRWSNPKLGGVVGHVLAPTPYGVISRF